MYRLFIIEDEGGIAQAIKTQACAWGMEVKICEDFTNVLKEFAEFQPHIVLLDITLPFFNGYHWCSEIRKISQVPIIFISSAADNMNIVMAMNMGADDFITKPFSPRELVLRVHNILRRIHRSVGADEKLQLGDLEINHATREVTVHGQSLMMTIKSFELLWILANNPQRVFSKTELYEKVWQEDFVDDTNTLNVHIHALRQDLAKYSTEKTPTIKTVWGLGYKIEV